MASSPFQLLQPTYFAVEDTRRAADERRRRGRPHDPCSAVHRESIRAAADQRASQPWPEHLAVRVGLLDEASTEKGGTGFAPRRRREPPRRGVKAPCSSRTVPCAVGMSPGSAHHLIDLTSRTRLLLRLKTRIAPPTEGVVLIGGDEKQRAHWPAPASARTPGVPSRCSPRQFRRGEPWRPVPKSRRPGPVHFGRAPDRRLRRHPGTPARRVLRPRIGTRRRRCAEGAQQRREGKSRCAAATGSRGGGGTGRASGRRAQRPGPAEGGTGGRGPWPCRRSAVVAAGSWSGRLSCRGHGEAAQAASRGRRTTNAAQAGTAGRTRRTRTNDGWLDRREGVGAAARSTVRPPYRAEDRQRRAAADRGEAWLRWTEEPPSTSARGRASSSRCSPSRRRRRRPAGE